MSLLDVMHQGDAHRQLQRCIARDRVPHAYLLVGPDGVGKETLAWGLAQLLLCHTPKEHPGNTGPLGDLGLDTARTGCGECRECKLVAARSHPDVHLIHRRLTRQHPDEQVRRRVARELGVDVIRHFLIKPVGLKPYQGKAKIFIIREADRINVQGQNALLKTLEEPPGDTFLILLAQSRDRLLETTLSRCQSVPFAPLPAEFVRTKLNTLHPDLPTHQADWIASLCDGSIGRAIQLANSGAFNLNERLIEGFTSISQAGLHTKRDGNDGGNRSNLSPETIAEGWNTLAKELGERLRKEDKEITAAESTRMGLKTIFHLAATWYADLLRHTNGNGESVVNKHALERLEQVTALAENHVTAFSLRAIDSITRIATAEWQLDRNVHTQLCVNVLVDDLCRGAK